MIDQCKSQARTMISETNRGRYMQTALGYMGINQVKDTSNEPATTDNIHDAPSKVGEAPLD